MSFHLVPQDTLSEQSSQLIDELNPKVALVIESSFNPELVDELIGRGCTPLTINEPTEQGSCVYIDQEQAGYLATQHLLGRGRRRIALLNGPQNVYWGFEARECGYRRAHADAGVPVDETLIRRGADAIDSEAGRTMMRSLIHDRVVMDGVVGVSDSKAMGALNAAREAGIDVPRHLQFVSIDDTIADQCDIPLTAVAMPFEEVGRQAALRALDWMSLADGAPRVPVNICLRPTLVIRD